MSIFRQARRVAKLLRLRRQKVVFAESCTGGLVSAALTAVPGISEFHCGGMVVYRTATKSAWLGVPQALLDRRGPVSQEVTSLLARQILAHTPEADLSAAVTGHLGPNSPRELDGRVFLAIGTRGRRRSAIVLAERALRYSPKAGRMSRQRRAVEDLLRLLGDVLSQYPPE